MTEVRFWRSVFSLLALATAIVIFFKVWSVLIPFGLGLLLAYLVHPLVDRLVSMGLRRDRVVVILYMTLLGAIFSLGAVILPRLYQEANTFLQELPSYSALFNGLISKFNEVIQGFLGNIIGQRAQSFMIPLRAESLIDNFLAQLPNNIMGFAHVSMWVFIVPFVAFFSLSQGRDWIDTLFDWTPSRYVESLLGLLAEINATLGGYIRGQMLEAICVGLFTMIGLAALGFEGAILLGCVTGLLNFVPFLALLVGGTIAVMAGYFQGLSSATLLAILGLYVVIRLIDDFVFIPFVLGHSVQLHPVLILLAVLGGYELGGVLGMVFAVPLAAIAKVVITALANDRRNGLVLTERHYFS